MDMNKIIVLLFCGLLWTGAVHANSPPVVSNVKAQQRAGAKVVDITYDVQDPDGDALTVSVEISDDDGTTWKVPARTFTGDVGPGIRSGTGKRIVWDAGKDVPRARGVNYRPKVSADDGQGGVTAPLPNNSMMDFVFIAPGTFTMGDADNGPQHQVTISKGFYLGKYEITQGQWQAVMGTQPWSGQSNVQANPNNPAVYISWYNMQVFIHKLNAAAGDSLYRLPTEAEWEYACRAGTTTAWSFGDSESQLKDYAWYTVNAWNAGEQYAHAVGTRKPNPWGLYDMHGNVWEWVQDWYGGYSSSSQTDPRGPATGSLRVLRGGGGGFFGNAQGTRSAGRLGFPAAVRDSDFGARLLRIK